MNNPSIAKHEQKNCYHGTRDGENYSTQYKMTSLPYCQQPLLWRRKSEKSRNVGQRQGSARSKAILLLQSTIFTSSPSQPCELRVINSSLWDGHSKGGVKTVGPSFVLPESATFSEVNGVRLNVQRMRIKSSSRIASQKTRRGWERLSDQISFPKKTEHLAIPCTTFPVGRSSPSNKATRDWKLCLVIDAIRSHRKGSVNVASTLMFI